MCILFVAVNQHPNYPLIICANRDEFHQRPTQTMHWWPETNRQDSILAGKDLQAGGTWLGLTRSGQFSALTNYRKIARDDEHKTYKSRGELVVNSLKKPTLTDETLQQQADQYQGFNLIWGTWDDLSCFDSINQKFTPLTDGYHSICNGAIDDIWPKMATGEKALEAYISAQATIEATIEHLPLIELMKNKQTAPDDLLPNTGIGIDWERKLSAIFIESKEYGTRSTCIITIDNTGDCQVSEVTHATANQTSSNKCFNFSLPKK